jgi:hypothetical protein
MGENGTFVVLMRLSHLINVNLGIGICDPTRQGEYGQNA